MEPIHEDAIVCKHCNRRVIGIPKYFGHSSSTNALIGIEEHQKSIAEQQKNSRTISYISLGVSILILVIGLWALLHSYNLI